MLISKEDAVLIFIDCQCNFISDAISSDARNLTEKWTTLAASALKWDVPIVVTAIEGSGLEKDGCSYTRLIFPGSEVISRICLNPWEHKPFARAVTATKRHRVVLAGIYTEGAITFAALSALREGYDTYIVCDATVGATTTDHEAAVSRMMQAGVVPITCRQLLLELGRHEPSGAFILRPRS